MALECVSAKSFYVMVVMTVETSPMKKSVTPPHFAVLPTSFSVDPLEDASRRIVFVMVMMIVETTRMKKSVTALYKAAASR